MGVGQVFGEYEHGADRAEGVQGFPPEPAGGIGILELALADVVHAGISEHMGEGFFNGHVFTGVFDDEGEFGLVVGAQLWKG